VSGPSGPLGPEWPPPSPPPSPPSSPPPWSPPGDDEGLLRALARAVALADPVPANWRGEALAGADWLAVDARLAELAYDSLDDHRPAGAARRPGHERRRLRFGVAGLTIEVELSAAADVVQLAGRLVPGRPERPRRVRALLPRESYTAELGDTGAFRFEELPHAPVSLLVEGDPAVKTGWIVP
jgi:hypothetical protein